MIASLASTALTQVLDIGGTGFADDTATPA